jgi:AraC-like DNA-binding protein
MPIRREPAPALRGLVSSYYGFREETGAPMRRREGPGAEIVVIISFGEKWLIDGERFTSFAAGLHDVQVTTEHAGRSFGMQLNLSPLAARMLFGIPLDTIARREVPLEDVLPERSLPERLHDAGNWPARFDMLDRVLARRLADAHPASREIAWAWRRMRETHGNVAVRSLAEELGWSRRRLVASFRGEVGLPPKTVARLLRFERARELAELADQPDWPRIAFASGYYDQSHLINEFRRVTGRTPVTFFQDQRAAAA